jgi:signal transduction histidine kinase
MVAVLAARLHYALRPEDIPNPYAATHLTIAATSVPIGAWIAARRRSHPLGWVVLTAGLLAAWMYAAQPLWVELWLLDAPSWVLRSVSVMSVWPWIVVRTLLLVVAPSVVPAGAPHGPRRWILGAGVGATGVLCAAQVVVQWGTDLGERPLPSGVLYEAADHVLPWSLRAQWLLGVAAVTGLLVVTLLRDPSVRRQARWFALAAGLLAVPGLSVIASQLWPSVSWPGDQWERLASGLLPVALCAAVVFDHLLDVQVVVRRTVLVAGLTVFGAAVFAALSGVITAMTAVDDGIRRASAAGFTAVAFVPTFGRWQTWIDRHVYGDTSRPERVLARLGRRLGDAQGSHEALRSVVEALADSLRLPFVSIDLDLGPDSPAIPAAAAGTPVADTESFPIVYTGALLGHLVVGRRTPAEPLRPQERELLRDLAGHVGVVLHDAHLEAQLRASREQIVRAREEERRRLRADLHDGLGPTLASVALGLDAASAKVDDDTLTGLLGELTVELRAAMDDVRRLVYGLRPPALDELGLARALEQHARAVHDRSPGLAVSVHAVGLTDLPAATEVAAYRIAMEAITNVSRHARANRCEARLASSGGSLVVEVIDDGVGIAADHPRGLGLTSMRERADELQGSLTVTRGPAGTGTVVRAVLPLASREPS